MTDVAFFLQRLPSLAGMLLVVLMLEKEVRLGVVVVCHGLGEVVVRPSLALSVAFGGVGVSWKGSSGCQSKDPGQLAGQGIVSCLSRLGRRSWQRAAGQWQWSLFGPVRRHGLRFWPQTGVGLVR